jgi:hypothetical protein
LSLVSLIAFATLFVVFFAIEVIRARRRSEGDSDWEREMKSTPWRDRWRIARAVRRGSRLDKPREARLAAEMAERQLAATRPSRQFPIVKLVIGAALLALGALGGVVTVAALGAFFLLLGLVERSQSSRATRRLERAVKANRAQAELEAGTLDQ